MNISEIIKGGSLGHGTALADESNLDLVVYLSRGDSSLTLALGNYSIFLQISNLLRLEQVAF